MLVRTDPIGRRALLVRLPGLLLAATCLLAGCKGPARPAQSTAGTGLLDAAKTQSELTEQLGASPTCLRVDTRSVGCEWRLSKRERGYRELARALEVRDRIGVICELPDDGSPRARDSCTLHQRRSNRKRFETTSKKGGPSRAARERVERETANARRALDETTTLIGTARLLGQLPESCDAAAGDRRCEWLLSNRSFGHGSVAATIGVGLHRRVRFVSTFRPDGQRVGSWEAAAL